MRVLTLWVLLSALGLGATAALAEEETWQTSTFVGPPPRHLMVSEHGTLRWARLIGDRRLRHGTQIRSLDVSPDSKWIVTGADNGGSVRVWALTTGKQIRTLGPSRWMVSVLLVSPDGRSIVTGADDDVLQVWDSASGKLRHALTAGCGADRGSNAVALSPDGKWVAADCKQKGKHAFGTWDLESGSLIRTFEGHRGPIGAIAVSPDGTWIVSGGWEDQALRVWDAQTGKQRWMKTTTFPANSISVSRDGKRVISLHAGSDFHVWNAATGALIEVRESEEGMATALLADGPWFSKRRGAGEQRVREVWNQETGTRLAGRTENVAEWAVSRDGKHIVGGERDGSIRIWDAKTGERLPISDRDQPGMQAMSMSPDGSWLATVDGEHVKIWATDSGTLIRSLAHPSAICLAIDAKGKRLVSGGRDIRVWDVATGKQIRKVTCPENKDPVMRGFFGRENMAKSVAFHPAGERVITAHTGGLLMFTDVKTGERTGGFAGDFFGGLAPLAYAPDGSWLAIPTGVEGGSVGVRIFGSKEGELRTTLRGFEDGVVDLAVSPTGRWIAAAGIDGTIRIFNVKSGKHVRTLRASDEGLTAIAISPDARTVYSVSDGDGTLRVWDPSNGALRDTIRLDVPVTSLAARRGEVWVGTLHGTIQIYAHAPTAK